MKINLLKFHLLLLISLFSSLGYGQHFSAKGFDLYWKSMQQIEAAKATKMEDLEPLWTSVGYSSWMSSPKSQRIFYNYFSLVHAPHLNDSLKKEMDRSEGYRLTLFEHFIEAKHKKAELYNYLKKVQASPLIEKAKKQAFTFLPDSLDVSQDSTIISLMIFQPDAFAVPEDNVILMDVLFAYNYGEGFEKFLGHELHHIYSSKYLSKLKPFDYDSDPLVWSIEKMRSEGIADLIDKSQILEKVNPSDYEMNYVLHFQNSEQHLETIDSLLSLIAKDHERLHELGKQVRKELPYGAHPMGFYMAKLILQEKGKAGIIQCLENPFTFLYSYNDIALKSDNAYFSFSPQSIRLLQRIEHEFMAD